MIEFDALFLSLKLASLTSLILLFFGLPLAFVIARSQTKWTSLIETLLLLPIVLPPTVLGFYLLIALSSGGLAFTFFGLVVGSVIYSFSFAFQSFVSGFQSIAHEFYEVSASLGDSPFKTFLRVAIPLAKNYIYTGMLLSFAHTLGEFGAVLMIGGNIPGETRTLSVSIYDQVQSLDFKSAHRTSLFLLGFSFAILLFVNLLKRKSQKRFSART